MNDGQAGAVARGLMDRPSALFGGLSILVIGPLPPPAGGMAGQTRQLAELLRSESASAVIVQTNAPYRPAWIGQIWGVRAAFRLLPYVTKVWRAARTADLAHVMANSGWAWHLFAAPAIWISALRGVPVIVNYRGGEADAFLTRSWWAVKATIARASILIVPSGYLEAVFAKYGVHARIVPNVVDVSRFAAKRHCAPTACPHLVVTRNLEPIYDIGTAIRAFATVRSRFPGARLTIAGTGPERSALEELAADVGVGDATHFTDRLDREQVAALYRSADLMINPSRVDNTPNSILEALATGVPVVTTNVGGIPFLVQHEKTALLVDAGDCAALASEIIRCLSDPDLAQRLVTNGSRLVDRFTWPAVRETLHDVYLEAMSSATPRPEH